MNRSGMTLLELVVALSITGAAVTAGYGAFTTLVDRKELAAAAAEQTMREASARASLATWVAGSRLTIDDDDVLFRGIDGETREKLADDDLIFFTTAPTPVALTGTIVRLFIDREDETSEKGLVVELHEWRGARSALIQLAPNVAGMDGRYLTGIFGSRQWVESWVSTSVLPAGTRLAFAAAKGDTLPPLWRLPLTTSIEGGR